MEPLASCKEFKQRRKLRSNGEIEEEGQEEGSQAKGNKEGGSGCFSTCNHIRRSSGEHNDILGLRADGSTSYFCYVEIAPYRPPGGFAGKHFFKSPVRNSADSFSGGFNYEEPRLLGMWTSLGSTCFDLI